MNDFLDKLSDNALETLKLAVLVEIDKRKGLIETPFEEEE